VPSFSPALLLLDETAPARPRGQRCLSRR